MSSAIPAFAVLDFLVIAALALVRLIGTRLRGADGAVASSHAFAGLRRAVRHLTARQ